MSNPLLEDYQLPPFSKIRPEHIEPAIRQVLKEGREEIERLLDANSEYTWDNLIQPLEDFDDRIGKAWTPVNHLNSVVNTDELREAYNVCLPLLSEYWTEQGHNTRLYEAYVAIAESAEFKTLGTAQQKTIDNALRDFRLSGIALDTKDKARFKEIEQKLSSLTTKFEENLLDATHGWHKLITDKNQLAGLPETAIKLAEQSAREAGETGYRLTLDFPCYLAIMTYAEDRALREELYHAFTTRASDQGPNAGRWDNTDIMEEILALRHEKARLLGFANYAELSLASKMAESPSQVTDFLVDLAQKSMPVARKDLKELEEFAKDNHQVGQLAVWDISYYSEKMRQHAFELSQEEIKTYFPAPKVIDGLFSVVEKLYGLKISATEGVETWHPDVRFFTIHDASGQLRGQFYLDLYARSKKRGGAWMGECITRKKISNGTQDPVAFLTCNFTPPAGDDPALLSHDEVLTLFHEFGHGLHHMLTRVDYPAVSGIHGVAWDAVELPSQFMENWCWEREALNLISGHYQTGEPLPDSLFDKMIAARNFQAGMQMVRQLEFSLFDFRIHQEYNPEQGGRIYPILEEVRQQTAVLFPPKSNRFPHSFSHIFAGGYAAGYYSYKWAEVLSSDAFSLFEENGIFDQATGRRFMENILEKGGSEDAMGLFVAFRGREPEIDALLRHNGIAA